MLHKWYFEAGLLPRSQIGTSSKKSAMPILSWTKGTRCCDSHPTTPITHPGGSITFLTYLGRQRTYIPRASVDDGEGRSSPVGQAAHLVVQRVASRLRCTSPRYILRRDRQPNSNNLILSALTIINRRSIAFSRWRVWPQQWLHVTCTRYVHLKKL